PEAARFVLAHDTRRDRHAPFPDGTGQGTRISDTSFAGDGRDIDEVWEARANGAGTSGDGHALTQGCFDAFLPSTSGRTTGFLQNGVTVQPPERRATT